MIISATWRDIETDRGPGSIIEIPILSRISGTDHIATPEEACDIAADYCEVLIFSRFQKRITIEAKHSGDHQIAIDCSNCLPEMLACIIYRLRFRGGQSQRAAAQQQGVTHSGVSLYESGKRSPGVEKLDALLSALGYDLEIVVRPKVA